MTLEALITAFTDLTEAERQALQDNSAEVRYRSGDQIIKEGQPPEAILVIIEGWVRVTHSLPTGGGAEFVNPLGPGEIIGEMSFVDGQGASATLFADGDVVVARLGYGFLKQMIEDDMGFAVRFHLSLLKVQVKRLRATNSRITLPFA